MSDEQLNGNCDEAVATEIDQNEPDSDRNSAPDQESTAENNADETLVPDQNNDQGSKVHCWNEFQVGCPRERFLVINAGSVTLRS